MKRDNSETEMFVNQLMETANSLMKIASTLLDKSKRDAFNLNSDLELDMMDIENKNGH